MDWMAKEKLHGPYVLLFVCRTTRSPQTINHNQVIGPATPAIFNYSMSSLLTRMQPDRPFRLSSSCPKVSIFLPFLLLSRGDVQPNPGLADNSITFGSLNVWLAVNKSSIVHDIINGCQLCLMALHETWNTEDSPPAIKLDIVPDDYSILHFHRDSTMSMRWRSGGFIS